MSAEIDCTVDLAGDQKGVHMSRFPELFDEAIDEVVLGEGLLVEVLGDRIASQIVHRQHALRAEVRIVAGWPATEDARVTGLPTQEMISLIGIAAATARPSRRVVGVEATGINACPCAQDLVRGRAAERLAEAGFGDEVERILELVPLATHNQRGRGTLLVGTARDLDAELLAGIVERSMSAPVYELLKRPDELHVVEQAHRPPALRRGLRPRRARRAALLCARPPRRRLRPLPPGEPRDDPRPRRRRRALGNRRRAAGGASGRRGSDAPDHARGLAQRLTPTRAEVEGEPRVTVREKRGSVPARRRPMLCRCSASTPSAASAMKPTIGHEAPNARQRSGSAAAVTIEASEAKGNAANVTSQTARAHEGRRAARARRPPRPRSRPSCLPSRTAGTRAARARPSPRRQRGRPPSRPRPRGRRRPVRTPSRHRAAPRGIPSERP